MFLGYIHTFRAIAIYFIIAMHCIDAFDWDKNSLLERILRISMSNGTVLFVFIAGYLFQHLALRYNYKKYLIAKFKNVITPYFIISIPAILVFTLLLKRETVWEGFYNDPVWLQVINFYITGLHLAPFWFIPVVTLFYLVSPLLVLADRSNFFYYLLPVFIIVSCFVGRGGGGAPFISFVHFFSVYSFGMFFSRYKGFLNNWLCKTSIILGAVFTILGLWICEFYLTNTTYSYFNFLQKLVFCIVILGVLISLGEKATHHYINLVADVSFGIFFVHSYVLTSGKIFILQTFSSLPEGNLWAYLLVTIITLLVCMAFIYSLKAVFGSKSRLLVGS
jgi:Acyltransferase family